MLKLFLLILISFPVLAQKLSLDDRRAKIVSIVNEELAEVKRLARQQEYKNPDTLLRISELYLEKARHYREAENDRYLGIPFEKRRTLKKDDYFKRSSSLFSLANKAALRVAKRFPKYSGIGEVYYILAYNNKELNNHKAAQKYFALSFKKAPKKSKVNYKAKLALGEYYFNDHKYKQAIPLYEDALRHVDEKWWTKDAFNLAWSYYRTRQYDKAIALMKTVHEKSSNPKYVDMRSSVERDIGIFFVDGKRMDDAIKFYESKGLNYTEQFVKIAQGIISQGRFAQAESLLNEAAKNEKDRSRRIDIYIAQLELFDKYNKDNQHLRVSRELVRLHKESPLPENYLKALTYQVDKKAAELQKATASNIYASVPKTKRIKARQSIAYFELSKDLHPNEVAEKTFFQGETAYSATNFKGALAYYLKSFDLAKEAKNSSILKQSLEGMLASLAQPGLNLVDAEKFYAPVYTRYLSVDSSSDRAKSIFVKLFNTQFDSNDIPAAENTLERFAAQFPKDYKTQEGMLAKIMEHHRKRKDYPKIKAYVADINSGKFKVSKKYARALRNLMTKIQIEGVQQSLEKGDKAIALQGYQQIYNSSESTASAKTNAAYNLAALYFEAGESNQSYQWGAVALKEMSAPEVAKFADSFLSISAGLFLKQHFAQSADLSSRVLAKLCKQNSSNKTVAYKNAVFISLANGDIDKSMEIRNLGKECGIPTSVITEVSLEIMKELAKQKRWSTYTALLKELDQNADNHSLLIVPWEELRVQNASAGDMNEARAISQKQMRYFEAARTKKKDIPVEALDLIADRMIEELRSKNQNLEKITLRFPESDFNNSVKAKLQILDQLTNDVNAIQKVGSGKGIVEAYRIVIDAYENFGNSLKSFVPEGKSPEYVTSFQKAMADVYGPILENARKQRKEISKLIIDNKILSDSNMAVLYDTPDPKIYHSSHSSILMDRGGRQ